MKIPLKPPVMHLVVAVFLMSAVVGAICLWARGGGRQVTTPTASWPAFSQWTGYATFRNFDFRYPPSWRLVQHDGDWCSLRLVPPSNGAGSVRLCLYQGPFALGQSSLDQFVASFTPSIVFAKTHTVIDGHQAITAEYGYIDDRGRIQINQISTFVANVRPPARTTGSGQASSGVMVMDLEGSGTIDASVKSTYDQMVSTLTFLH